ncbi:unnamed protein product [Mytilus coruscus]|uniref:Uncharacterized protein n=1 Tax=Mytilus coruscus TaxID=42192 RepID=A0A6J8EE08_MYTCO|nr:unnamed protein product [Mytilus coruscus]
MASLSVEEDNYVRMSLLLTGISPRAVRTNFNYEFDPAYLDASLKREYDKLLDLKQKHRINQSQWNLLFPRSPDVPDSNTFDVTLMVTLLRNLTKQDPTLAGFDRLPATTKTSKSADLVRIKYYRNYLAHLDDGKVDTTYFDTAWLDITEAIGRLGGQQLKQECNHLKTKPLDQTNQEIMLDVKRSNDEIRELKESFESLKLSHTEMKLSHKLLQESNALLQKDYAHVTEKMEEMKIFQKDPVPWNIREVISDTLNDWKVDDKMFIDTKAAQIVLKCIKEHSCVTITASSGVGKTATLRHVALQMANEEYDVLMVTEPGDIVKYNNPIGKTLFVFDDLCGNFSVDQTDIKSWDPNIEKIKKILDKKQIKILAACRLQVFRDEKFESLSIFKSCVCNLLSENMCLSKKEKLSIADLYLKTEASEITEYCNSYDCFPLLCKLYHDCPKLSITDFFQNPFSVYEAQIMNLLKKGHHTKYCALALCVMFNNKLEEEMLTEEVNKEIRTVIKNTCEVCRLDRGTSRFVLRDGLESLKDTFIKQEQNVYKIIHDKIFDFLAYFFGQKITLCLINNADSGLIKDRFLLERKDDMDQFITIIPSKYHHMYIQRMIADWSKGKVQDVFSNINMKIYQFRQTFLFHLKTLDRSYQRQLANICDKHKPLKKPLNLNDILKQDLYSDGLILTNNDDFDEGDAVVVDDNDDDDDDDDEYTCETALLQCGYIGDISLVLWCCNQDVDVNMCTYRGLSPVMIACKYGYTKIVKILLDKGTDCNKCDNSDQSPVMLACEHGHTEIVTILLDKGVDCNKCDNDGQSPVMLACEHGHAEIFKMLLDKGVDCNKCYSYGRSPVMMASQHGHTEIFKMLLGRGVDCYVCDNDGQSPVMLACENGSIERVMVLLDRGADCNKFDNIGQSPLMKTWENGRTDIVKTLIDRMTDYDQCADDRQSPVMKAYENGHT